MPPQRDDRAGSVADGEYGRQNFDAHSSERLDPDHPVPELIEHTDSVQRFQKQLSFRIRHEVAQRLPDESRGRNIEESGRGVIGFLNHTVDIRHQDPVR